MTLTTDSVLLTDHETAFVCKAQNDFGGEEATLTLSVTGIQIFYQKKFSN